MLKANHPTLLVHIDQHFGNNIEKRTQITESDFVTAQVRIGCFNVIRIMRGSLFRRHNKFELARAFSRPLHTHMI